MSKKKFKKYSSIGLVALFTVASFPGLSNASSINGFGENVSANTVAIGSHSDSVFNGTANLSEELVNKVDPFINLVDGEYIISNKEELQAKITSTEFKQINEVLNEVNSHLKQLKIESEKYNKYTLQTKDNAVIVTPNKGITTASKEGRRGIEIHWNHVEIYLTKTDVGAILKGGASGGTAALGAAIGSLGQLPGAIAGAAIGAAAGTIVNEYVKGVPLVIYMPYWKPIDNMKVYRQ
ncbi:hypothetical protein P4284_09625 [Bacillus swezeyi]|uniref:hypothetical protein n=1 Tax=Bacillus swezeyi TaxID=1925020 RepID=UPI002E1E5DFE|nr:hypothetical protein [Bacillus swezeyi]MED2976951.1 hypothetical protein [Bacillus swezeyi]